MKKLLSALTVSILTITSAFGQVNAEKFSGKWYLCGDINLSKGDTVTYNRADTKCNEFKCSKNEWNFREDKHATYSWGTACDNFFNQIVTSFQWSIENKSILKLEKKDGTVFLYKILHLDNTKLTLVKE